DNVACTLHVLFILVDFIKVNQNDKISPNCSQPVGFLGGSLFHTVEQCFSLASTVNANVVYILHLKEGDHCKIYKCELNNIEKDWNYSWTKEPTKDAGVTYALPHEYNKRCHNSYFVRKMDIRSKTFSGCYLLSRYQNIKHLRECEAMACNDKANTFNFYNDSEIICETMHCEWNTTLNDYDLKLKPMLNNRTASIYRLSHVSKPCNTLSWNDSVELPFREPNCWPSFSVESFQEKDENLQNFCSFGANTFQNQIAAVSRVTGYRCPSNEEGTDWKYSPIRYDTYKFPSTKWITVPYPGTPNCNSSYIYKMVSHKDQNQMANCSPSKTIQQARDLRQCMIYACELGFNVINYDSSTKSGLKCHLLECHKHHSENYDFEYVTVKQDEKRHKIQVYALQYETNQKPKIGSTLEPPKSAPSETPAQCKKYDPLVTFLKIYSPMSLVAIVLLILVIVYLWNPCPDAKLRNWLRRITKGSHDVELQDGATKTSGQEELNSPIGHNQSDDQHDAPKNQTDLSKDPCDSNKQNGAKNDTGGAQTRTSKDGVAYQRVPSKEDKDNKVNETSQAEKTVIQISKETKAE
ncbi:unnamed protein product, partial [Owenia fusiformis]